MPGYIAVLSYGFVLGLSVAAPLGPTSATAIRRGLASGAWAAFWVGMGAALTDFLYITLTWIGIAPVIDRIEFLIPVLYLVGAVVLGRMGIGAVREALANGFRPPTDAAGPPAGADTSWRAMLLLGISVTMVNPATITSWLSIGGAFVAKHLTDLSVAESLGAMLAVMAGSAFWFSILASIVGLARASIGRLPWLFRAVGFASGVALLAFAAVFAWGAADYLIG
jgi:threonine/homoserine/homoserine lactone efflux protein